MSSPGSVHTKDSSCGSGHHKKSKRKRHRNKFRNSTVRKKRTKKFYCGKKANSFKLETSKLNLESEKIMSNWYWSNYKKAVEWQDRHKTAHWKACALALMEENRYLLQIINDMQPGMAPEVSVTQSNLGEHRHFNREILKLNHGRSTRFHIPADGDVDADGDEVDVDEDNNEEGDDNEYDNVDDEEDDIEFEMSEEMIQFFEQSYRHKMDMKKLKEKELLNKAEEEIKQMQTNKIKRSSEMNLLYGDGASMIIGMETAVQLSFDKYCDTKSPKYWPNIPFRL